MIVYMQTASFSKKQFHETSVETQADNNKWPEAVRS